MQSLNRKTTPPRPFSLVESLALKGDVLGVALVRGLLQLSSPLAVVRGIRAVIVDAFNPAAIRTLTHVLHKLGKREPRITDIYSTTSVVGVEFLGSRVTTTVHVCPHIIKRVLGHSMSLVRSSIVTFWHDESLSRFRHPSIAPSFNG